MSDWADKFRHYSLRTNFHLGLTRPMLEYLCAVAQDCWWDRAIFRSGEAPDNFIASSKSLLSRGLIRNSKEPRRKWNNLYEIRSHHELTPAGEAVVKLLRITGLFIEADLAAERKAMRVNR